MRSSERLCGVVLILLCLTSVPVAAQSPSVQILPDDAAYDPAVPTVEAVLGQSIGDWHLRHDQLLSYLEVLAEASPRLSLEEQGRTHEGRRQVLLVATSPANQARLDEILERRRALTDPDLPALSDEELADLPSVAYLGYSIHGNEASGSNASALVAYYLAASESPEVEAWLSDAVVLIDPSLNPDGMGRFAQWANMHRGVRAVADADHREHREGWPSGRTNHYWFDLNRDWLLLQHPESRHRVYSFHRWKPNVLGDYHEMGSDSTYFFQPGVPERENPFKPDKNIELTHALAELHARNLDAVDQLYYSAETFDDFYPGKGSTYPDLNGAVGVLFEQASARGHVRETVNGDLSFARAIRNHFLTSLSMIEGAATLRDELLRFQSDFYREASALAASDPVGGYAFGCPHDARRCGELVKLLRQHQIEVHELAAGLEAEDGVLDPAWSWVVPLAQPQYRLIKALFERQTEFTDSTFYDVSSWAMPLAFGTVSMSIDRTKMGGELVGEPVGTFVSTMGRFTPDAEAYAYLFEWSGYYAPRALQRVMEAGLSARLATEDFQSETLDGVRDFSSGTIIVPVDEESRPEVEAQMLAAAEQDGIDIWSVRSGLTSLGPDLGSPSVRPLATMRPLIVVGGSVSSYEVGEAWHLLDNRFGIEVSLVEVAQLETVDLSDYDQILMVNGGYGDLDVEAVAALRAWVEAGGVLVASKGAAVWADENLLVDPVVEGDAEGDAEGDGEGTVEIDGDAASVAATAVDTEPRRQYADYQHDRAAQLVSGAIFEIELDLTHPIAYGYQSERLPVFRNADLELEAIEDPYARVGSYSAEPRLSGYISDLKLSELGGRPAILVRRLGSGTVVQMDFNPNFRAFWYGTSKLYLNALFFGASVDSTSPPADW